MGPAISSLPQSGALTWLTGELPVEPEAAMEPSMLVACGLVRVLLQRAAGLVEQVLLRVSLAVRRNACGHVSVNMACNPAAVLTSGAPSTHSIMCTWGPPLAWNSTLHYHP